MKADASPVNSVAGANVAKGCSMPDNRKLYISDWHYGHQNILAFDNRPFRTVEDVSNPTAKAGACGNTGPY